MASPPTWPSLGAIQGLAQTSGDKTLGVLVTTKIIPIIPPFSKQNEIINQYLSTGVTSEDLFKIIPLRNDLSKDEANKLATEHIPLLTEIQSANKNVVVQAKNLADIASLVGQDPVSLDKIADIISPYIYKRRLAFLYALFKVQLQLLQLISSACGAKEDGDKVNKLTAEIGRLNDIIKAMLQFHTEGQELNLLNNI